MTPKRKKTIAELSTPLDDFLKEENYSNEDLKKIYNKAKDSAGSQVLEEKLKKAIEHGIEKGFDFFGEFDKKKFLFVHKYDDNFVIQFSMFPHILIGGASYTLTELLFEPTHSFAKFVWGKDLFAHMPHLRNILDLGSYQEWIDYIYDSLDLKPTL